MVNTERAITEAHAGEMTRLLTSADNKLLALTSVASRAGRHLLSSGPGARSTALEGGA